MKKLLEVVILCVHDGAQRKQQNSNNNDNSNSSSGVDIVKLQRVRVEICVEALDACDHCENTTAICDLDRNCICDLDLVILEAFYTLK